MALRLSLGALGWPGALLLVALGLTLGTAAPAAAQLNFGPTVNVSSNGGFSRQPHIVIDASGVLHVAWADDTGAADTRILYSRSFNQGASFTAPVTISTGVGAALRPRLATHGSTVHLVWMQDDATAKEIMFSRSLDGGQSFSSPVNLSQTPGESQEGRVAAAPNGSVFVVWDEASPSRHIAMRRSLNGGADFEAQTTIAPVLMTGSSDPNAPTGSRTPYPGVAVDPGSGNVYLVWHDLVGSDLQVRFSRSTNNGASFSTPLNVSGAAIHAHCASISVGPTGTVLLAWENRKQITPHTHDSYVTHSTDGGLSFSSPVNLSNGPSWALSDYPWAVQGPGGIIVVGWEDNTTSGDLEAVIKVSTDGGFTFGPMTNLSNTPTTSTEIVTLFGPDGTFYIIWEEQQNPTGPGEILFRRGSPPGGGQLFADVPVGYWARAWIEALFRAGVTGGCVPSPLQYCPEGAVTRAQMAVFLLKARHGAGFTPPAPTGVFGDVPPGYWAAAWIEELVREGITAGCGAGRYCPEAAVTRAQMAVFILKALNPGFSPPPPSGMFGDVPPGYWAAAWIEELARRGIAAGCGTGRYCPEVAVTRAQMAVLLVNAFQL